MTEPLFLRKDEYEKLTEEEQKKCKPLIFWREPNDQRHATKNEIRTKKVRIAKRKLAKKTGIKMKV